MIISPHFSERDWVCELTCGHFSPDTSLTATPEKACPHGTKYTALEPGPSALFVTGQIHLSVLITPSLRAGVHEAAEGASISNLTSTTSFNVLMAPLIVSSCPAR